MDPGNGSTTNPVGGLLSESLATGSFVQIALEPDGLFNLAPPNQQFGAVDLFPNESDFGIGSLSYDDSGFTGSGVEVFPVTSLDTSDFWQDGSPTTDISDTGLDIWFFGLGGSFAFGAPAGSVTLTNGLVTSIDIIASVTFTAVFPDFQDPFSGQTIVSPYTGALTIAGNAISIQIDETNFTGSTFVADLQGTVNAVVPEPSAALLAGCFAAALPGWRRRG